MDPNDAASTLCRLFIASWILAAAWSARTFKRPAFGADTLYTLMVVLGLGLLVYRADALEPLWSMPASGAWLLVGLLAACFAFCWWARLHLGKLWAADVSRKDDHHVVDTGPYGLVRHPMYTGFIGAALVIALMKGEIAPIAGAGLWTLGFWLKARLEEQFLRAELGAATYDAYAARVPMLIPFYGQKRAKVTGASHRPVL